MKDFFNSAVRKIRNAEDIFLRDTQAERVAAGGACPPLAEFSPRSDAR